MTAAREDHANGAIERLVLTRGGLRIALREAAPAAPAGGAAASERAGDSAASAPWLDGLLSQPTATLVREALRVLWSKHPWRDAASAVGAALDTALRPTAPMPRCCWPMPARRCCARVACGPGAGSRGLAGRPCWRP